MYSLIAWSVSHSLLVRTTYAQRHDAFDTTYTMLKQAVNTASENSSIWRDVSRDKFTRTTGLLNDNVAGPARVYETSQWPNATSKDGPYVVQLKVEHQLADDFAFLAAIISGPIHVSAAAVEAFAGTNNFVVRLAANEGVSEEVVEMFRALFEKLSQCAQCL